MLYDVILPLAIQGVLTYEAPPLIAGSISAGKRVLVPIGKKKLQTGIVLRRHEGGIADCIEMKQIVCCLDERAVVTEQQLRLWQWIADYYMCSEGEVMRAALPAALKPDIKEDMPALSSLPQEERQKLFEHYNKRGRQSKPSDTTYITEPAYPLNEKQQQALTQIRRLWTDKDTVLLRGVTGSGKTEIYIHLIEQAINEGKQVLYMVPEIALTTQLTERLRRVFGSKVGVYHSRFTDRERAELYRKQLSADEGYSVILGVRSSVFLPFSRLGLVIVDEEHDHSYKQYDPAPRYHARNTAIMLARLCGAKVLLGSATPQVESYYNALTGKYGLVTLESRYANLKMPIIEAINTREHYRKKQMRLHLTDPVADCIKGCLQRGEQVIVFQNRRGYAPYIECKQCAYIPKCTNCDVNLTLHKKQNILTCHYCGYTMPVPKVCPACGEQSLTDCGLGTEKAEDELSLLYPEARIQRMDQDTTRKKDEYRRIIDDFGEHRTDILVGTQMLSKGLDFDGVSTVIVLNADNLMNYPDFRSYEYAYQLLEQVSGRAGRKNKQGRVLIQTSNTDNPILHFVARHDYESFYRQQIEERQAFRYPPFYRLIRLTVRHRDSATLRYASQDLQNRLQRVFAGRVSKVTQPLVNRVQNLYISQILLKIEVASPYQTAKGMLGGVLSDFRTTDAGKHTLVSIDIDPM